MLNQQYQEPWLAIVVDPVRTASTGKVEIGAFRTYPQGYKPPEGEASEFESVPLNKIEDFGAHQNQYYQLEISYFKSASDTALLNTLWNKCAPTAPRPHPPTRTHTLSLSLTHAGAREHTPPPRAHLVTPARLAFGRQVLDSDALVVADPREQRVHERADEGPRG